MKHFRRLEAEYRAEIRRAREAYEANTVDPIGAKKRYEKTRSKYERKIDKVLPKIHALTIQREELKSAGKG